ncbi:MAG: carboxylesterase family protein, partial [Prevotella sp.]|nr:carboxylesterase family protein [Prevotella sp.]
LYQKGNYNDVPVLIMHNSDEGAVEFEKVSVEQYEQQFKQLPGQWADSAKAVYPGTTEEERLFSMRDFVRDVGAGWPSYAWATLQKQTGKSPVYMAYLAQKSDTTVYAKGNRRGAAHADDMMYLKGAFDNVAEKYPQEKKVSDLMQQYWVNFAKTMNPDGEGLPHWPVFEDGKPTVMQFNNGTTLIEVPNKERIRLIDGFMQYVRSLRTTTNK